MYQNFHTQLNKNWMNDESKKFRFEGFLQSVKHWKIPDFVVEVASVHFNEK